MNSKFAGLELAVDKPQRLTLLHPNTRQPLRDKKGEEAWIDLYSADSDVARKHNRAIQRRLLNVSARGQRIKRTPEELEAEGLDLLVALTTGWRLVSLSGDHMDVPFTAENARELYGAPSMAWLREQVDEFAADRGNFSGASSPS